MSLELSVEVRRLKIVERQLSVLQHEAAELCDAMIVDTREGYPTAALRLMLETIRADVRSAIEDWDIVNVRISAIAVRIMEGSAGTVIMAFDPAAPKSGGRPDCQAPDRF